MEGHVIEDKYPPWMNIENSQVTHNVTPHDIKYDGKQLQRCRAETNQGRFKDSFGVLPATICKIYEDLENSNARSMRLKGSRNNLKWFLWTIYYLRKYPTENDMERQLTVNKGWASTNIWEVIEKIQYLKFKKITWPNDLGGEDI
jgi:hypothetical protein